MPQAVVPVPKNQLPKPISPAAQANGMKKFLFKNAVANQIKRKVTPLPNMVNQVPRTQPMRTAQPPKLAKPVI